MRGGRSFPEALIGLSGIMNVLHIVATLDPEAGGLPRSVKGFAEAQVACGADVSVLACGVNPIEMDQRITRIVHSPLVRRYWLPRVPTLEAMKSSIAEADVVHLHGVWNGVVSAASRRARTRDKPIVLTPHGMLDPHNLNKGRLKKKLMYMFSERKAFENVHGWHFLDISEQKRCALGWKELAAESVVVPNGLQVAGDAARTETLKHACAGKGSEEPPTLVFMGRLHSIKGIELQLEAVRVLHEQGIMARLKLVGPDDGAREGLVSLGEKLGVSEYVEFPGAIYGEERLEMLREADAVLLSSHYECNSVTAAEVMAVGGVLVATETCNLDNAGTEGAAVITPRNATAYAAAIAKAISTHEAPRIRVAASRYARKWLDRELGAMRLLAFYRRVSDGRAQTAPRQ